MGIVKCNSNQIFRGKNWAGIGSMLQPCQAFTTLNSPSTEGLWPQCYLSLPQVFPFAKVLLKYKALPQFPDNVSVLPFVGQSTHILPHSTYFTSLHHPSIELWAIHIASKWSETSHLACKEIGSHHCHPHNKKKKTTEHQ